MRYFLLFLFSSVYATQKSLVPLQTDGAHYEAYFTGPLFAPTPVNMDPLHPSLQATLGLFATYGNYQRSWALRGQPILWQLNPSLDFQMGFTERTGLEIYFNTFTGFQSGQRATRLGDTTLFIGAQIANEALGKPLPDIRLNFTMILPSGSYNRLDPEKQQLEATGDGSYQLGWTLVMQKTFNADTHPLILITSIEYLIALSTRVHGFNTYGGGYGTSGRVKPGNTWTFFFSGEYSLSQRWAIAFDSDVVYTTTSRFCGTAGQTASGGLAHTGLPHAFQVNIAPEVEYNFSNNLGILWGIQLSLLGRSSEAFAYPFFSVVYTF